MEGKKHHYPIPMNSANMSGAMIIFQGQLSFVNVIVFHFEVKEEK
jgi:hypothetical protein